MQFIREFNEYINLDYGIDYTIEIVDKEVIFSTGESDEEKIYADLDDPIFLEKGEELSFGLSFDDNRPWFYYGREDGIKTLKNQIKEYQTILKLVSTLKGELDLDNGSVYYNVKISDLPKQARNLKKQLKNFK